MSTIKRSVTKNGPLKVLQNDKGNKKAHNYLVIVHFFKERQESS
jgi:hypothetical protein